MGAMSSTMNDREKWASHWNSFAAEKAIMIKDHSSRSGYPLLKTQLCLEEETNGPLQKLYAEFVDTSPPAPPDVIRKTHP